MSIFLQVLITGIAMGFIYALVGVEYTIIWNATGLLNFSHDKFIMLSAYVFAGTYMLGLGLPLLGIAIAYAIFRYMALYDLFLSCDPQNAVLFLVLSIFVGVTRPFFLFACRNKDYGMSARRDAFRPGDGPME